MSVQFKLLESQYHSIARRPADSLDLALEDLNLSAERQHLSLQLGLIAMSRG
jgi:hypothetical protein